MVKFGNMRWGRFAFTAFGSFCLKKLSGSPEPPKQKNFHKGGAGAGGHFVTQIYIAYFLYIEATFYHEKMQKKRKCPKKSAIFVSRKEGPMERVKGRLKFS